MWRKPGATENDQDKWGAGYCKGAPFRKIDPKVATAPKTQSPLTTKVEIRIKFNNRSKR